MKRFFCTVLIAVMALMVSGCQKKEAEASTYITIADGEFFSIVESWKRKNSYYAVLRHNETGVCYFYHRAFSGSFAESITVMLNPDGTPYTGEWEDNQ